MVGSTVCTHGAFCCMCDTLLRVSSSVSTSMSHSMVGPIVGLIVDFVGCSMLGSMLGSMFYGYTAQSQALSFSRHSV